MVEISKFGVTIGNGQEKDTFLRFHMDPGQSDQEGQCSEFINGNAGSPIVVELDYL